MSNSYIKPPIGELFNGEWPGSPAPSSNNAGNYLIIFFVGVAAGLILYFVAIKITRPAITESNKSE
jgi:hypothetical protein